MSKRHTAKILIADDNPDILAGFTELLELEGYLVYSEANGKDAVKTAREIEPDIILLDVNMPVLSGLDACKILRETPETQLTPIVIITGDGDESTLAEAIEAGSDDFVTKPPNDIILRSKIASLLNLNRMRIRYHEREKLNYMINNMSDCLIITDEKGGIKHQNSNADHIFMIKNREYREMDILELLQYRFNVKGVSWQRIQKDQHGSFMISSNQTPGENITTIRLKFDKVVNPSNGIAEYVFVGSILDKEEKSNQRMQYALEKAEAAEKVKKYFLSNISHEIRTPLNSILGFSTLVEDSVKEYLPADELVFFENIKKSSERLMKTVHEIADISQIEAGSFNLMLKPLELIQLLNSVIEKHRSIAGDKEIQLNFTCPEESVMIYGDEYCITEAINNLLDNAIKYTDKGSVDIQLDCTGESDHILVIRDSGIGMSKKYQENLFESFSQESTGFFQKNTRELVWVWR